MANIVGVSSDFIDDRRKSLLRWLTIITSHPTFREDGMIRLKFAFEYVDRAERRYNFLSRVFLTDNHSDHATFLRDQFRHFPDEFVLSNIGHSARDQATPGLRSQVMTMKSQVSSLEEVITNLSVISDKMVVRLGEEQTELTNMARELTAISNNSVFRYSDTFQC